MTKSLSTIKSEKSPIFEIKIFKPQERYSAILTGDETKLVVDSSLTTIP